MFAVIAAMAVYELGIMKKCGRKRRAAMRKRTYA